MILSQAAQLRIPVTELEQQLERVTSHKQMNELDAAREELDAVVKGRPRHEEAWFLLGIIHGRLPYKPGPSSALSVAPLLSFTAPLSCYQHLACSILPPCLYRTSTLPLPSEHLASTIRTGSRKVSEPAQPADGAGGHGRRGWSRYKHTRAVEPAPLQ